MPQQCKSYKILDEPDRNIKRNDGLKCDDDTNSNANHGDFKGPGWYRMMAPAGTRLVEQSVGSHHCGTYATGWLEGSHSGIGVGQTVERKVCFDSLRGSGSCAKYPQWNFDIKIRNCGNFFIPLAFTYNI